jgi:hypothetical protein
MKSLFEEEEKETAINHLKVDLIARFYPLTKDEVIKYKEILFNNASHIVWNKLIHWDYDLIEVLKDKLDWDSIWRLPNIKFDLNFFKKYEDRINFKSITSANSIEWSDEFVAAYGDKFEVDERNLLSKALSNFNFVKMHKDKMDWRKSSSLLNFEFTDQSMSEIIDYIDWDSFSRNSSLPLTFEFFQKYEDKWNLDNLSLNPASLSLIYVFPEKINWNWNNVISNRNIKYDQKSFDFIYKYYQIAHSKKEFKHDWSKNNPFYCFMSLLILRDIDMSFFLNEKYISFCTTDKFSTPIFFNNLSRKSTLKLSIEFIEKYKDKLNFKESALIRNLKDVIDEAFIIKNHILFDFNHYSISDLPISRHTLFKYSSNIDWNWLSRSQTLDWNWEFIKENWDKLNDYILANNKGLYERLILNSLSKEEVIAFLDSQGLNKS